MLAALSTPQPDVAVSQQSPPDIRDDPAGSAAFQVQDRLCPGCKQSAVTEDGGLVVAFGQSFFHVDCFRCAKCGDQVTADTNLLLLSDGSPICAKCSYSCNVCHLPILDEAIMTGEESYHAHCFKCKICKKRIDELVFARTSQGIYCMDCHNERMIKLRKHAQRKAERERAAGGSGSSRTREHDAQQYHRENGQSSSAAGNTSFNSDTPSARSSTSRDGSYSRTRPGSAGGAGMSSFPRPLPKPSGTPFTEDPFISKGQSSGSNHPSHSERGTPVSSLPSSPGLPHSFTFTPAPSTQLNGVEGTSSSTTSRRASYLPPASKSSGVIDPQYPPSKNNTLPVPSKTSDDNSILRRKSYDDGVRPLDILFKQTTSSDTTPPAPQTNGNLSVATSRRDKRRSINPGLVLENMKKPSELQSSVPMLSPNSMTFGNQLSRTRSETPPSGRDSPLLSPSMKRSSSDQPRSPRPTSGSNPSHTPHTNIASASTFDKEYWQEQTIRSSPASSSTYQTVLDTAEVTHQDSNLPQRSPLNGHSILDPPVSGHRPTSPHVRLNDSDRNDRRLSNGGPRPERLSSTSSLNVCSSPSPSRSRPTSPAHQVDVPQSVETGTDTEATGGYTRLLASDVHNAPPLPPKEGNGRLSTISNHAAELPISPTSDSDHDNSLISHADSFSDDLSESSPVERQSTFIAPALPPIRFSMNAADFSDLLNAVGSGPSLKPLDLLSTISEKSGERIDEITPPTPSVTSTIGSNASPSTADGAKMSGPSSPSEDRQDMTITSADGLRVSERLASSGSKIMPALRRSVDNETGLNVTDLGVTDLETHFPAMGDAVRSSFDNHAKTLKDAILEGGSVGAIGASKSSPLITVTESDLSTSTRARQGTSDQVIRRLQEVLADAQARGAQQLKLDKGFVEVILASLESKSAECLGLKGRLDGMKRESKQYVEGMTVAQTEYDRELKARRDAEAEVTRLKVLLTSQVARLTALSGDNRREELRQKLTRELNESLSGLEEDLSKLRVERDMTLAEVEELSLTKSSAEGTADAQTTSLSRSLTTRLDKLKAHYQRELVPLTQQRESLAREIAELKAVRDVFLEETTVLNARNEELAQLGAQYSRRVDALPQTPLPKQQELVTIEKPRGSSLDRTRSLRQRQAPQTQPSLSSSMTGSSTFTDDTTDTKYIKVHKPEVDAATPVKKFKWPGAKARELMGITDYASRSKGRSEHSFQQLSILRFTRCDLCSDMMWGSQLRCSVCHMSIHVRCIHHVNVSCVQLTNMREDASPDPAPPSMFGRDLSEQVRADTKEGDRQVPVIVEKCIAAVEASGLEYEGIYRKTGGTNQSKTITQLFERGNYDSFDLCDSDRFNDISSITSVLKTYFRALPVPLLTYDLHDGFISAIQIRDPSIKSKTMTELVRRLPAEHYYTLRMLMLHLNRVCEWSEKNLMTARNLGLVFGPTIMRSPDPGAEFSDMAGKALSVEWLIESAPLIFS